MMAIENGHGNCYRWTSFQVGFIYSKRRHRQGWTKEPPLSAAQNSKPNQALQRTPSRDVPTLSGQPASAKNIKPEFVRLIGVAELDVGHMKAAFLFVVALHVQGCSINHSYRPTAGYVPNSDTASTIAEAVWKPIYGSKNIEEQKPFETKLIGNIWYVSGSLTKAPDGYVMIGGTAEAEIDRRSGKILRISHGK